MPHKRRPYVFVVMPFDAGNYWLFRLLEEAVNSFDCACIHAGHLGASGYDLRTKIHVAIERAELVIAEISEKCKPNVFYELGYGAGQRKELLLLKRKGAEVPSDFGGIEWLEYDAMADPAVFREHLRKHLQWRLNTQVSFLRDMLQGIDPRPAFIVAHPKFPDVESPYQSRIRDERTFGDNLCVVGLLSAFGSLFGETNDVELISAQYAPDDLGQRDINLYLVGSSKVNPLIDKALRDMQANLNLTWEFCSADAQEASARQWLRLCKTIGITKTTFEGEAGPPSADSIRYFKTDYGILIRGPKPGYPDRVMLVIAGAHSLGTGAACLSATRSPIIRKIKDRLRQQCEFDIADKTRSFWVLVKGKKSDKDGMLDIEDVKIEDVGVYVTQR